MPKNFQINRRVTDSLNMPQIQTDFYDSRNKAQNFKNIYRPNNATEQIKMQVKKPRGL